ncbi:MAG TPA: ferritin-like fold-containing protein [Microbacteriaceae bacterium]|nr:ferritin-like fold-containing protein [Microbacteriaceae bacterium]
MSWIARLFGRTTPAAPAPTLPGRRESGETPRADFADFTPDLGAFLGHSAYVQLEVFEGLARAVLAAPTVADKEALSRAAARALTKQQQLVELIVRAKYQPAAVMEPFAPAIDAFKATTTGNDWWELLVSSYVTAGILDDFFIGLAAGLPAPYAAEVAEILSVPGANDVLRDIVAGGIEREPQLAHRLALWARRLVGDTLLVARSALAGEKDFDHVEPVFTELIAGHSRRLDALGLTA